MWPTASWFIYLLAAVFGACVGSFLNVCIVRIPRGKSVIWPPSHCPSCEHRISWWENIPLVSYIILRGKCRQCGERISIQYFLVELITALLSIAVWWYLHELRLYLAYFLLFVSPLIVIAFIDLEHRIIPDIISLPGIITGLVLNMVFAGKYGYYDAALDSIAGIIIGGGFLFIVATVYEKLKKAEGMGGGDVKLAAMLGAFFGWRASIFMLLVSSVLGSFVGVILILVMKKDYKYAIPFGPFLVSAAFLYFFFGERLVRWYLNLF